MWFESPLPGLRPDVPVNGRRNQTAPMFPPLFTGEVFAERAEGAGVLRPEQVFHRGGAFLDINMRRHIQIGAKLLEDAKHLALDPA